MYGLRYQLNKVFLQLHVFGIAIQSIILTIERNTGHLLTTLITIDNKYLTKHKGRKSLIPLRCTVLSLTTNERNAIVSIIFTYSLHTIIHNFTYLVRIPDELQIRPRCFEILLWSGYMKIFPGRPTRRTSTRRGLKKQHFERRDVNRARPNVLLKANLCSSNSGLANKGWKSIVHAVSARAGSLDRGRRHRYFTEIFWQAMFAGLVADIRRTRPVAITILISRRFFRRENV